MTDRRTTNPPTDLNKQTDMRVHRKFTLPINYSSKIISKGFLCQASDEEAADGTKMRVFGFRYGEQQPLFRLRLWSNSYRTNCCVYILTLTYTHTHTLNKETRLYKHRNTNVGFYLYIYILTLFSSSSFNFLKEKISYSKSHFRILIAALAFLICTS